MALSYAFGAFVWNKDDIATTTYPVTGLGFTPKALRVSWMGHTVTTDTVSASTDVVWGVGFAASATDRRCVIVKEKDAQAAAVTTVVYLNNAVAGIVNSDPAVECAMDFQSFDADGFTLVVDLASTFNHLTLHWEAWGGSDITAVGTVGISEPAATGNQDYTITGFTAGATDQVVMFAGCQVASDNTATSQDSGFCIGYATGASSAQCVAVGNSDQGSLTMDTDGYCQTGECLAMIVIAGGTSVNARASLTQFNTNGFRLNWAARATTGRRYIAMGIKGGSWTAGGMTINGNSGGATAAVSGLSYAPVGLTLVGRMTAQSTAATAGATNRLGTGHGTSPTSRQTISYLSQDNIADSNIGTCAQYDQVLAYPSTTGTLLTAYDISSMDSGGFTLVVDTAGGVASEWIGYLTFGSAPVAHWLTLVSAGA